MFSGLHRKRLFNRGNALVSALLFNTFSSYFIGQVIVDRAANTLPDPSLTLLLQLIYPSSIIASAALASAFFEWRGKRRFFTFWLLLGICASSLLAGTTLSPSALSALGSSSSLALLIPIALLGGSLGLGMPMCLDFFSESVAIEERGKVAGVTLFATVFSAPPVVALVVPMNLAGGALLLSLWRSWGLPLTLLIPRETQTSRLRAKAPSIHSIVQNKTFGLYFAAWLMFAFINAFGAWVVDKNVDSQIRHLGVVAEPAIAGVSALAAGIVSDWVGRKRVLISGFVAFGLAYAAFLFLPRTFISWVLFFAIDGLALGLLWVVFTIVLWGEVDRSRADRYYALGESPLFLTQMVSLLLATQVPAIPLESAFSMAAFFLFVAVIPLVFARETLPESKIEERQLRTYTEEALKMKQEVENF